jgi:hypothetical protein
LTTECSAPKGLPASRHDVREPGRSRSNTRTGRDRTRIETGGQVNRHRSLLPSFLGRRSFAPPLPKGMIEYDHRDQILAFLLPASHSGRKFIEGRAPLASFDGLPEHGRAISLDDIGGIESRAHPSPQISAIEIHTARSRSSAAVSARARQSAACCQHSLGVAKRSMSIAPIPGQDRERMRRGWRGVKAF